MIKTLIFVETNNKLDNISKLDLSNSLIFSFNIQTHKFLEEQKIEHTIGETYLSKKDHEEIFKKTISFWDWHKDTDIPKSLYYENINILSILDTNELHQILVREIYQFFTIKRIIEKENPTNIICSQHTSKMIKSISNNLIKLKIFNEEKHNFLVVWDKVLIRFNIGKLPLSISISRKTYTKIKNSIESFLGQFFNLWFNPIPSKKSTLFLEFNPLQYTELLENLNDYDGNLIFLNRRRSAMWNFSSIKILKKFNCKIVTPTKFLTKNEKNEIFHLSLQYLQTLDDFWSNSGFFDQLFLIEGKSFWNCIDEVLLNTYKTRLSEYLELIIFSKKFLKDVNIESILCLNVLGETEKSILDVNNNKISSILLEHAAANYVPEISLYDISSMYPLFKDKIAIWGNIQKEYLKNIRKISEDKILNLGSSRHDSFFNNKIIKTNSSEKIILLTPQVVQEYNAQTDTNTYLRLEILLNKIFDTVDKLSNVKLIVKMHPTLDPGNEYVKKLIHKLNPNIKIFQLESILDIINSCDIMINITNEFFPSTVMTEGLILNKPILNIYTMDEYYDFEFIKDNATYTISDKMDIEKSIHKILFDNEFCNELLLNAKKHIKNYFVNPGSASKELSKIIKN